MSNDKKQANDVKGIEVPDTTEESYDDIQDTPCDGLKISMDSPIVLREHQIHNGIIRVMRTENRLKHKLPWISDSDYWSCGEKISTGLFPIKFMSGTYKCEIHAIHDHMTYCKFCNCLFNRHVTPPFKENFGLGKTKRFSDEESLPICIGCFQLIIDMQKVTSKDDTIPTGGGDIPDLPDDDFLVPVLLALRHECKVVNTARIYLAEKLKTTLGRTENREINIALSAYFPHRPFNTRGNLPKMPDGLSFVSQVELEF